MKRLIDRIQTVLGDVKPLIEDYKCCFLFIAVGAIFMLFLDLDTDFYEKFILAYFFTVSTIFFIETYNGKSKYNPIFSFITFLLNLALSIYLVDNSPTGKVVLCIFGVYYLLGFLSIYKISLKEDFSKYLLDVFSNSIIVSIGGLVIQLGLFFIIFLISTLLFDNLDWDFYVKIELLYLELIVLPSYLLSLLYFKKDFSKLLKHLIVSIIVPLLSIALVILYLYLIKILILLDIPKNYLFLCVSLYLVVFFPIWFMLEYYEKDSPLIKKLRDISFFSFIPLWFVQVYSMGIRILNNGITISRYFAVMIIIFEVFLFYFIYTKKREKYSSLFLIGGIIVFISLSVPMLNSYDVSFYSQKSIIKNMVPNKDQFDKLDDDGQRKVISSIDYIKYSLDMEDKLDDFYLELKPTKYSDYYDYDYNYNREDIYYNNPTTVFPTMGYDSFSYYDFSIYSDDSKKVFDIYKDNLKNKELDDVFYKYIDSCMENGEVSNYVVKLDDDTMFYVDYLSLTYNTKNKEIDYLSVRGYLFYNGEKKNN